MKQNQIYREQVADLFLTDPEGNDLVISSPLQSQENGWMSFQAREDKLDSIPWKITFKIEEC